MIELAFEDPLVATDPWRILVTAILSNRSRVERVKEVLPELLSRWSVPERLAGADEIEVSMVLHRLSLHRTRAKHLIAMSRGWIEKRPLDQLEGIGQYGIDALDIFIEGRTDVLPASTDLRRWLEGRKSCV